MSILELRGVSKIYGEGPAEVKALIGADLSVEEGELVAVMGPSGSGKSTLLTIAGTLEEPTEGTVVIGGRCTEEMSRNQKARLRRREIGFVFQDFNLLAGLDRNFAGPGYGRIVVRLPGCLDRIDIVHAGIQRR